MEVVFDQLPWVIAVRLNFSVQFLSLAHITYFGTQRVVHGLGLRDPPAFNYGFPTVYVDGVNADPSESEGNKGK